MIFIITMAITVVLGIGCSNPHQLVATTSVNVNQLKS